MYFKAIELHLKAKVICSVSDKAQTAFYLISGQVLERRPNSDKCINTSTQNFLPVMYLPHQPKTFTPDTPSVKVQSSSVPLKYKVMVFFTHQGRRIIAMKKQEKNLCPDKLMNYQPK